MEHQSEFVSQDVTGRAQLSSQTSLEQFRVLDQHSIGMEAGAAGVVVNQAQGDLDEVSASGSGSVRLSTNSQLGGTPTDIQGQVVRNSAYIIYIFLFTVRKGVF